MHMKEESLAVWEGEEHYSLEMPKEEMPYPLIGQSFFEEEAGQWIVKILLVFQNLMWRKTIQQIRASSHFVSKKCIKM